MKILVAINEDKGVESKLSEHFGHCPFFAMFDSETKSLEIFKNNLNHSDSNKSPVDQIMVHNPDIVFTLGIGKRAIDLFKEKGVKLATEKFTILKEVIDNVENLKELNDGCSHEHH